MLPPPPNLAAASAFIMLVLASSASGRALNGGDSAEVGGQEDRMDSQVSDERVSVVLPYVPERSGYYHRWSSVDLEDQIADESALSLSYDGVGEYSSLHQSLHRPFLVHPSSSSSLDPDEGIPVVSYFVALFMALAFVAFFTSNVMAGAIAAGNSNSAGFGDKSRTPPPQEIGQKEEVMEKAAEVMTSVEELEEAFRGEGEASVPDEEVREKMEVSDGGAEDEVVKAQGTSEDIAKKEGDGSDEEEARRQQYELLQRVLRDKTAIWSVEGEEKRLLLQALEEQRRRLMGIKKEEEKEDTTTTTGAPVTDAAAEETSSTTTETEPSSTSQEPLADLEGSSLLVLRPVPWTFSEGRDGSGRRANSRQERSLMSRRRQQQQLSSSSFAGLDGSATALLRFPLLGVIGALVLLFHSAALAYRYLAQEAGGGGNNGIDEEEEQSGDGIVRAVEEAAEEIIRDLVDAGHLDWAGSEIEAAPMEQKEEEKAVIPSRSTTTTTTTRTTTTATMSTTTFTTETTSSTATTSTASQAEPEAATTIPPSSPSADLALLPRLLVRNDGVGSTPAFLTANDLPIFASPPPPPPPPPPKDAATGRRRPSPVVEMNQGGTEGSSNYKLVATSSDLLAGSGAEAAAGGGGQHRHHRPWVVFSALRMAEASEGHSGESFEVFREQHHESDRSVPPLAELGSLFPQGKKEEEVTIVTPEPQQQQLQPQQQQHLGIMEPFGGANLNKAHHRMREEEERRRRKKDRVVSQLAELRRRRRRRRKEDEEGGDKDVEVDVEEEEEEVPELWQLLGKR